MKGNITERNGSLRLKVPLGKNPVTGKYEVYVETFPGTNVTEARKRLRVLLTQIDRGVFVKPKKTSVGEYLGSWLKDYAFPNLSPRTAEGYALIVNQHLIPALGKYPLSQLKPAQIQSYYTDKLDHGRRNGKGGLSALTVRHHHVCLHTALQGAVKMSQLSINPCDAVTAPKFVKKEMSTMDKKDIQIFLEYANDPKYNEYRALFYTVLVTGMRRSELLALRWQDCDLLTMQISVNRTLHSLTNTDIVFRPCKTTKSKRTVELSLNSVKVLEGHRDAQQKLRDSFKLPDLTGSDLVFSHYDGKPLLPNTVSHVWKRLAKRTGLTDIHFHSARHTMATIWLKEGIHPKIVQERLGHASIQITLDTYSHVTPGMQQAAANRIDVVMLPKVDSTK